VGQDGYGRVYYDTGFLRYRNQLAPTAGIDSSTSMEFRGTCGGDGSGNNFYYNAFSDVNVTIEAGDKLIFDMIQNSINARCGIDAVTDLTGNGNRSNTYSLRDWNRYENPTGPGIKDQNGLYIHPDTDLGSRPVNQWYHREFDMTPAAGYTLLRWSMAHESEVAGDYYARFRNVYVLDRFGRIKATLFKDRMALPGNTSNEQGANGYTNLSKETYDPRAQLAPDFRLLYNALYFCLSDANMLAGNKRVLFLGTHTSAQGSYALKGTNDYDYSVSLSRLCAAAGFTPTFKDTSDYAGGQLDETSSSLSQYAIVVVLSSFDSPTTRITQGCIDAVVDFRRKGGGVLLITDHGPVVNTAADAVKAPVGSCFFFTANLIAVRFGAWFSGSVDRSTQTMGSIQSYYGASNHPLFGGFASTDQLTLSLNESMVVMPGFTKLTNSNMPTFNLPAGNTSVKVAAMRPDHYVEAYQFDYAVVNGEVFDIRDKAGNKVNALDLGWGNLGTVNPTVLGQGLGNLSGSITKNDALIGTVSYTEAGGSKTNWGNGYSSTLRLDHGDVVKFKITSPFAYEKSYTVTRIQPAIPYAKGIEKSLPLLHAAGAVGFSPAAMAADAIAKINAANGNTALKLSRNWYVTLGTLRSYFNKG